MDKISPHSLSMKNESSSVAPLGASTQSRTTAQTMTFVEHLVTELINPNLRENALRVLSKRNELSRELAPLLWNSFGTIAVLLQEITSIYCTLSPPTLTLGQSTRACNVLALLQCVASHSETRMLFLNASIPLYLYPFLKTKDKSPQFEYLRLASLGVIGALVKDNTKEVLGYLILSEVIPLCLSNMEIGNEISQTAATFIIHKILFDDDGLAYVCATAERFFAVRRVLDMMFESLDKQPTPRLLKFIIPCYARLSDGRRAGIALANSLPSVFRDTIFLNHLREDPATWKWVKHLQENVEKNQEPLVEGGGENNDIMESSTSGQ
ncbi:cell differentiation RCD1-like protein [Medicago truncatula]|uniref:Cell differentiation RCD1-like protein n=1 Tax=Medicago truncatula TaxID=3880 RepID=Q1SN05_MEDTR|nr:Cell differentiation proteins, Rcd1-like [Medicago truncatula]AET05559.2 cell differentiation RCD1-like protein [Medicago truncatula]